MNAIAAIAAAFLRGEVLTIKTAFKDFGTTNLPRECGRAIERKFGVKLAKVRKDGKSRWGVPCSWFEYRLPTTEYNAAGRKLMEDYVKENSPKPHEIKTDRQAKMLKKAGFSNSDKPTPHNHLF